MKTKESEWFHLSFYNLVIQNTWIPPDCSSIVIAALMIDQNFRSKGVGDALVQQAGKSASSKNVKHLRIRTNLITPGAYGFFEHLGFVNLQSQELFVKEID